GGASVKANTNAETLGDKVNWVIKSVAEVRHLGQMSREHSCHRATFGHGARQLCGGGLRVLRCQQCSELEPRRIRFAEVVQPIVVGPHCNSGKVTFMQAADMQSCGWIKHHHVDAILVHGRYLILGPLWLGT